MNERHSIMRNMLIRVAQWAMDPPAVLLPGWNVTVGPLLAPNRRAHVQPERLAAGLVLILPGIEGPGLYARDFRAGLQRASVPAATEIFNWSGWLPGACAAVIPALARRAAERVVARVGRHRDVWPDSPIVLLGHSAGAAVTVLALERLADVGQSVHGAILAAPALSPGYDLSNALAAVRRKLLACHSRGDVQLRAMTTIGGNFDRRFGRTAGQDGFHPPARHAGRLEQLAWDRSMASAGHRGGHVGWSCPAWVGRFLVPHIIDWMANPKSISQQAFR